MVNEPWRSSLLTTLRSKPGKAQMIHYIEHIQCDIYVKRNQTSDINVDDCTIDSYKEMLLFCGELLDFIDNENRPDAMAFASDFQQLRPIAETLVSSGEMGADVLEFFV